MKALLIGGTGNISASVTTLLIETGWDVTLLNRGMRPLPKGAVPIVADIRDEQDVQSKLAGQKFDVVADFIGFHPADVERDIRLFSGITGQYIFISSTAVYQRPLPGLPITEGTSLTNPFWEYAREKIACEQILLSQYRNSRFPVTIVRPSHTYDKTYIPLPLHGRKGSWAVLNRMLGGKPVIIHGDGTSLWTLTHSRDFAKGFVGLMANRHAIGEAVHITSDESITWNDVFSAFAEALNVPLRTVYMPSSLLAEAGAAYGYDFGGTLLGDKASSVIFDNAKIKRLVPGFAATTLFGEGAREIVEYYRSHSEKQTEDLEFDHFCDKMIEIMDHTKRAVTCRD